MMIHFIFLMMMKIPFHFADGFQGDMYLVLKLLLPGVVKIIYNLNSKQLVKIFSSVSLVICKIIKIMYTCSKKFSYFGS